MGFVDRYRNKYQTGGLQHLTASQIRQEVGEGRFSSYFKFAVVRNPFDRLVSQFAYMRSRADLRAYVGMSPDASFAEYLGLIEAKLHVQWAPQCSFLYDGEEREVLLVDFVARFESIIDDAAAIFEQLGLADAQLPHLNQTRRQPYRNYFTARLRRRVEDMYREDLDRLGYGF